jgi:F0F1-type ATP synthase gamma subunit
MRSQRHLRDELRFLTEFNALFDVVEQGAVSRLHRLDEQLAGYVPLGDVLEREFFPLLPPAAAQHPLVRGGSRGRLLVVITSDEGLVGFLHTAVIREAIGRADGNSRWVFVGQRGPRLLGVRVANAHLMPAPSEDEVGEQVARLSQFILAQYRRQALRDVWLVSPRFVSMTRQDVIARQLLPLPWRGPSALDPIQDLVIEPSADGVVEALAARWVEAVCRDMFWSARRAEFAARTLHIESSRQELAKQTKTVQHAFFKTMHERVDVMVRETCVVQRHVVRRKAAGAGVR